MGLDMYLKAEKYFSGYSFAKEDEKKSYAAILSAAGANELGDPDSPSLTVKITVGYWRKANAVHAWFVKNVQDGRDECQEAHCEREQLMALKVDCMAVLANPQNAKKILPTQAGFFFGSTDIDEYYLEDLRHTVAVIDKCLGDALKGWSFIYRSSW